MLAILSNTLFKAEEELRKKQHERNMKWTRIKLRLNASSKSLNNSYKVDEDEEKQKIEINALWSSELNGLNNFINNLSKIKTVVVR